jgi:hypothetical protein
MSFLLALSRYFKVYYRNMSHRQVATTKQQFLMEVRPTLVLAGIAFVAVGGQNCTSKCPIGSA